MAFETVRTIATIKEDLKAYQMARHSGLRAYEETSVLTTINEAMAKQIQVLEQKGHQAEIDLDVYQATGDKLVYLVKDRLPEGRLLGARSVGQIQFGRNLPALRDYIIPKGTMVYAPSITDVIVFETLVEATLPIGETSVLVNSMAQEAGLKGNVDAFTVTVLPKAPAGIDKITNPLPFVGGTDPESDDALRIRYLTATSLNGRATIEMLERHLVALANDDGESIVAEAQAVTVAPGEAEVIVDTAEVDPMPLSIEQCIEDNIGVGIASRGILAASIIDTVVTGGLGTSRGGKIFLRAKSNLTNSFDITVYYHDQLVRDRTAVVSTPEVFLEGEVIEMPLEEDDDLAIEVTGGINVSGGNFDVLIGHGHYPYLYNLPEKITVDVYLQVYFTETPEADLEDKIYDSVRAFLDAFKIGERFEYSDLYSSVLIDSVTGIPFIGIQEIKYLKGTGKGTICDSNGSRIILDSDERIDPGVITIEILES